MRQLSEILAASALIMALLAVTACASTEDRRGTGEYFDDAVITTKVRTALIAESDLRSSEISVETFENIVQLSGFVSSVEAADHAVSVASEVAGVRSVRNDMRIR